MIVLEDFRSATDVSADGSVIVLNGETGGPILWENGAISTLGIPYGYATAINADASVVVGFGAVPGFHGDHAFRWEDGELVGLGILRLGGHPKGGLFSYADDVSAEGSVVVGSAHSWPAPEAFRWEDGVMTGLGRLEGGNRSDAVAVSADGSVVIGNTSANQQPFIWDAVNGMRSLEQTLRNEFGLDLTGWRLTRVLGMSDDGRTIVGQGSNSEGRQRSWIAVLPEPTIAVEIDIKPGSDPNPINPMSRGVIPVAILGSDTFDVAEVDVTTLAFGPDASAPLYTFRRHWDLNRDGFKDLLSLYRTEATGIAIGAEEACVTGETIDADPFHGCDAIETVPPCGEGFELAFVLLPAMWLRRQRRRRIH